MKQLVKPVTSVRNREHFTTGCVCVYVVLSPFPWYYVILTWLNRWQLYEIALYEG